jgi:HAD superfamily hydrolase (TIGR01509 family)
VCGLSKRKGDLLARRIREAGVTAAPGARRYLEAAARAGLERAVVSASANVLPMLELSGLADLVDARVDAEVISIEGLRSRPAPDLLLVACTRLGVAPEAAVSFTHTAAGVAAGRAAGLKVVGVTAGAEAEALEGFGADLVVPGLGALLDGRLAGL